MRAVRSSYASSSPAGPPPPDGGQDAPLVTEGTGKALTVSYAGPSVNIDERQGDSTSGVVEKSGEAVQGEVSDVADDVSSTHSTFMLARCLSARSHQAQAFSKGM